MAERHHDVDEAMLTVDDLSEFLRHRIDAAGGDVLGICEKAGVSKATVYRWLRGGGLWSVAAYMRVLASCGVHVVVLSRRN